MYNISKTGEDLELEKLLNNVKSSATFKEVEFYTNELHDWIQEWEFRIKHIKLNTIQSSFSVALLEKREKQLEEMMRALDKL